MRDSAPGKTLDGHGFLNVVSRAEFCALLASFAPLGAESVPLEDALGRVLAADLPAPEDLPQTARASMDGYALSARSVFGATETNPAYADCVADLRIDWSASEGQGGSLSLESGQCARIPTGGTLPDGADAVIMVEHTGDLGAGAIEVRKSVAPGENVMLPGEDVRQGEAALPAGRILRAQDVGLLAALGQTRVGVGKRPRVGILSTGDELVPAGETPKPGQIRDVNTSALVCLVAEAGGVPVALGIIPDDLPRLTEALAAALESCDVVLLSGGSSIGARDHSVAAMLAQPGAEILAHGVAMSPGKPTILARVGRKAVIGLPGQVTSAQVVQAVLVTPFLRHLAGRADALSVSPPPFVAELARNIAGRPGREDFVRIRLEARPGLPPLAHPVLGKSGLLKTLLEANALIAVPAEAEGLYKGALVPVWPL
ncbi:MAG: molybdopterin molybdotransferase MoeA [Humidesulfovibrio sp.]|uniref:molybdopterin molybdotransferase MoeA n=1 Tax=Humidesulfovibrio sp. TaxID=2910988 RepID=UPI0027340451|nr:gephyrin-like molybdotransferase Glp [Humidesulfovibrio sp.]MDP2848539.1 molybdopterin molybdotransferase MoeA [Humidesulfovibrio sp.]